MIADDASGAVTQQNAFHNTLKLFYYGLLALMPGACDTPLYFITVFPASIILFIPDFNPSLAYYLIPILNAVLVLRDAIVQNSVAWPALGLTSISLLATALICWFVTLRLFTRETLLIRS